MVVLILAIVFLAPSTTVADEAFLGKIVSINLVKNEMAVEVVGGSADNGPDASSQTITIHFSSDQIRSDMKPGTIVRVWGKYNKVDSTVFESNAIREGFAVGDPTGVRYRIRRGRDTGGMSHGYKGGTSHGYGGGISRGRGGR